MEVDPNPPERDDRRRFRCFACLQDKKPKTRRASEISPGLCCENCIHYNRVERDRKRVGSYIYACLLYDITQEIGWSHLRKHVYVCMYIYVSMCMPVCMYVCTSSVSVYLKPSSNLIKERGKD